VGGCVTPQSRFKAIKFEIGACTIDPMTSAFDPSPLIGCVGCNRPRWVRDTLEPTRDGVLLCCVSTPAQFRRWPVRYMALARQVHGGARRAVLLRAAADHRARGRPDRSVGFATTSQRAVGCCSAHFRERCGSGTDRRRTRCHTHACASRDAAAAAAPRHVRRGGLGNGWPCAARRFSAAVVFAAQGGVRSGRSRSARGARA
jgi:hypothetical protein